MHRLRLRTAFLQKQGRQARQASSQAEGRDWAAFTPERIRNFGIIAHVDHGKSTLSDRLLSLTNTIKSRDLTSQYLDKLQVERERGITVKAQSVSMVHSFRGVDYMLNLIDTPGHSDFSFEVERSLNAVQGAILLVDAAQGVQAQTISVFNHAVDRDLTLLPVLNKVDLPQADPDTVARSVSDIFDLDAESCIRVSAKSGDNCTAVLDAIVERIPAPKARPTEPFKALLFDSYYNTFKGAISLIYIVNGSLKKGDKIQSCKTQRKYEVQDLGIVQSKEVSTGALYAGQVGWLACNMKEPSETILGDTFHLVGEPTIAMPAFKLPQPMVFAGIYPIDPNDFPALEQAIARLMLNDPSVTVQRESSLALGQGCRLGMLGQLHMDVFQQRLVDEYGQQVLVTAPTVPYKVIYKDGSVEMIRSPTEFPDHSSMNKIEEIQEPVVNASIIVTPEYVGDVISLCGDSRGDQQSISYLGQTRVLLKYQLPLSEVAADFYESLKSRTSGFASFDYTDAGYVTADVSKMELFVKNETVDALSFIVHNSEANALARKWVYNLKGHIPRQQFAVPIQAAAGGRVLARETLSAYRKDVTLGVGGGDVQRKKKVLAKQKIGKKKLESVGRVSLPQSAFKCLLVSKRNSG